MGNSRRWALILCIVIDIVLVGMIVAVIILDSSLSVRALPFGTLIIPVSRAMNSILHDNAKRPTTQTEKEYMALMGNAFKGKGQSSLRRRLVKAVKLFDSKKYEKSLRILNKLELKCSSACDYSAVYAFMGLNYNRSSDYKQSVRFYLNSLAHNPNQVVILGNVCTGLVGLGKYEEAAAYGKKAIECNSSYVLGYVNVAFALAYAGRFSSAMNYATHAHKLDQKLYQPLFIMAVIHLARGNKAESDRCRAQAIGLGANIEKMDKALRNLPSPHLDEEKNEENSAE